MQLKFAKVIGKWLHSLPSSIVSKITGLLKNILFIHWSPKHLGLYRCHPVDHKLIYTPKSYYNGCHILWRTESWQSLTLNNSQKNDDDEEEKGDIKDDAEVLVLITVWRFNLISCKRWKIISSEGYTYIRLSNTYEQYFKLHDPQHDKF